MSFPKWLSVITCVLGIHKYRVFEVFKGNRAVCDCERCGAQFLVNADLEIVMPWTQQGEDEYRAIDQDIRSREVSQP